MIQSSGLKLKNNIQTVHYILKYTQTVYNDFVQHRIWDQCIIATPGKSGLVTTNNGTSTGTVSS